MQITQMSLLPRMITLVCSVGTPRSVRLIFNNQDSARLWRRTSGGTLLDSLTISYVKRYALATPLLLLNQRNSPSERTTPLEIHGFVYGEDFITCNSVRVIDILIDVATGAVKDLNVTAKVDYTHQN